MTENKLYKKGIEFAIEGFYRELSLQSVIYASGEDAVEFVQGQVTQDISKLKPGEVGYAFLLTQKGRVVGDLFVIHESAESLRLVSWSMPPGDLIDRLEAYIIADDVELVDETGNWKGWQLGGSLAVTWGREWVEQMAAGTMGWCDHTPLAAGSFCLLAKDEPHWPDNLELGSADDFERARIATGIPRVPVDLGPTDFPQEAGQEKVGVSFNKGCYLGQEVMARLATTGRIRRGLFRVSGDGRAPETDLTELKQGERVVGELRSRMGDGTDGWLGLAMLNVAHFDSAQDVVIGEGHSVRVTEPV